MKLSKISKERNDWHFWQILIVCSGSEFKQSGEALIQSIELNSPDTRVVVLITDKDEEAKRLLGDIGQKLMSIALYEAQMDEALNVLGSERYQAIATILEMTRLPTLAVRVDSFVRKDLSLLPVELQKCDCAVPLRLDRKHVADRVRLSTLWFAANHNSQSLLKEITRYLRGLGLSDVKDEDERKALYFALLRCSDFVRAAPLPGKYCDRKDNSSAYVLSDLASRSPMTFVYDEIRRVRERFEAPVTHIVFYPKQDLGTKASLKNNQFKMRVARLARPGRIYWRHMSRFLAEVTRREGHNARIVALPQWEINAQEIGSYPEAEVLYLPHLIRKQLDHPKARYYMQELLPSLFTIDRNGWGAASQAFEKHEFQSHTPDERLDRFLRQVRDERTTKAPQNKSEVSALPKFDILVPLQVPGDDALIHHAEIGLEKFVETLAEFANRSKVTVLLRKHPYDNTTFYQEMEQRFKSPYVHFDSRGHIHDVLQRASAVAVINSGVGFEAMIYNKPILSFGRSVYDLAVGKVDQSTIDSIYASIIDEDPAVREQRYRRFISWYVFIVGVKIDEEKTNIVENRLDAPDFQDNPTWLDLQADMDGNLRGIKQRKLRSSQYWRRLRARSAHIVRRWDRARTRNWLRFRKSNTHRLDAWLKSILLPHLDQTMFEGKRVALVGNASSLRRGSLGDEIDSHDIVIRMNLGYPLTVTPGVDLSSVDKRWIHTSFVDVKSTGREALVLLRPDVPDAIAKAVTRIEATGRKTDIWSCSTSDRSRQVAYAPVFQALKVACHPAYEHLSWKLLLKNKVYRLSPSVFDRLSNALNLEPTSGLIWIDFLAKTKLSALNLYGFDFFASGHIVRTTPNVLQAGGKWPHDPAGERLYVFENILKEDPRIRLVDTGLPPSSVPENS